MKYSLRSLMIVVTLTCILLGGRVEYLRRMAVFHAREAERCELEFKAATGVHPNETFRLAGYSPRLPQEQFQAHEKLAAEYRNAILYPWVSIKSPAVPTGRNMAPNPMSFSIRDLLLVTVIVALAVGWWVDRYRLAAEIKRVRRQDYDLRYFHQLLIPSAPAPNPPKD